MPNSPAARIAFIGAGNHSTQSLYPNIAHIPEFDLVAVCDTDADKAAYAARKYGAPQWFTDVDTMFAEVHPDGACVCGPGEMHHAVGLQVLRHGVPLFSEKPPGMSLANTQELLNAARDNGVWGMVAFMKRFAPANVVAKEFMGTEAFGAPSSITLIHTSGPYDDPRRMLLFNGIHMIDLGRFLCGDVASVFAHASGGTGKAQAVSATMRFTSGAVGQLNMNSGFRSWSDCFEQTYVSGTGAALVIDASRAVEVMSPQGRFAKGEGLDLFGWSNRYYVSGNMAGWTSGGHYTRGYCGEMEQFAKALLGQAEPSPSLEDGVAAMRLIEAMLESAETGKEVGV
jgi:predicted dehydrogenase